jgi:hypothetical protein
LSQWQKLAAVPEEEFEGAMSTPGSTEVHRAADHGLIGARTRHQPAGVACAVHLRHRYVAQRQQPAAPVGVPRRQSR